MEESCITLNVKLYYDVLRDIKMRLLGQDTTIFAFHHNPIPEKISFIELKGFRFRGSKRFCTPSLFNSRTKTKKFYPIIKMTTLKDFEVYLNEMYVTLKLDDSKCRIHSVSDGNEEIVTNERYVIMPWKMVTRCGANMTLEEVVEEIMKEVEEKRLVSEFEAKHKDEILEILGVIDYIDQRYIKERFPEIYNFGPK